MKLKDTCSLEGKCDQPRQYIKKQRHCFAEKGLTIQSYGFSSSHVWMWVLDHKVDHWRIDAFDLWYWRILLRVPWTAKEIQPVHPKGDQSWIFIERTDAEAEPPVLWPHDVKNWLFWKDPDVGKEWRQEKGMTEDETVAWHHWLNGHEFEQAPGVGDGQGSLVCYSPCGLKESDTTEWTKMNFLWCLWISIYL